MYVKSIDALCQLPARKAFANLALLSLLEAVLPKEIFDTQTSLHFGFWEELWNIICIHMAFSYKEMPLDNFKKSCFGVRNCFFLCAWVNFPKRKEALEIMGRSGKSIVSATRSPSGLALNADACAQIPVGSNIVKNEWELESQQSVQSTFRALSYSMTRYIPKYLFDTRRDVLEGFYRSYSYIFLIFRC